MMCLFLWQANIYPVLGLGNETMNPSIDTTKIIVQHGETLWQLAKKYQTTVDELVKLNQVKRPDHIRVGQSLWVPKGETKKKTETLGTMDVKEYSKEVLTTLTQDRAAEKVAYTPWWANMFRSIPAFATIYRQPEPNIQTYEIFVNQDLELPEKVQVGSLPDATKDSRKLETQKALSAISSESQVHSRGLGRLVSKEELELLSRVIYGEARGEDFLGQVAVGAVVINRLNDSRFPKTIRGVIYESGAFTAVNDRQIHLEPNDQAYKAAEAALSGLDPTNGAIFYYNPRTATDRWIKSRTVIKRIGNHTFSI